MYIRSNVHLVFVQADIWFNGMTYIEAEIHQDICPLSGNTRLFQKLYTKSGYMLFIQTPKTMR